MATQILKMMNKWFMAEKTPGTHMYRLLQPPVHAVPFTTRMNPLGFILLTSHQPGLLPGDAAFGHTSYIQHIGQFFVGQDAFFAYDLRHRLSLGSGLFGDF